MFTFEKFHLGISVESISDETIKNALAGPQKPPKKDKKEDSELWTKLVGVIVGPDWTPLKHFGDNFDNLMQLCLNAKVSGGTILRVPLLDQGITLIIGASAKKDSTPDQKTFDAATKAVLGALSKSKNPHTTLVLPTASFGELAPSRCLREVAKCAETLCYKYNTTLSFRKKEDADSEDAEEKSSIKLESLTLLLNDPHATDTTTKEHLLNGQSCGMGINQARELASLPGNFCTPKHLAKHCEQMGKHFEHLEVDVLTEEEMEKLGMGSLLSVGKGSVEPSRLIVIKYNPLKSDVSPTVFVGKGITFDTGGISIKPSASMDQMKFDMGGAAATIGCMLACAQAKVQQHLIGIVAAAENMPDGKATKPGDVVTAMDGTTIEVLNTDAEGRLVLCDALSYSKTFNPAVVIDMATLTGACVVALGHEASALYSDDEELVGALNDASARSGDTIWHMPMFPAYAKGLKSNFADLANIGGTGAGSAVAACFLKHFTKDLRWAHLDIAGTAWSPAGPKAPTGRPVSLLFDYISPSS